MAPPFRNLLYYGDNLDVLRRHVATASVDLVYLDPPFNSNQNYNVIFDEKPGTPAAAQIQVFRDTWEWNEEAAHAFVEVVEDAGDREVARVMSSLRAFLRNSDMMAYLAMMAPRLLELRRALKETGSIFLHCDPTASHYLKILMDSIFGAKQFRNEIVWCYTGPGSPGQRQFSRKHDVILWYSVGDKWTFNSNAVRMAHNAKTMANYKSGLVGSGFVGADHVIHPHGKVPEDWWPIAIAARGREYLHYPTQKPLALLERIIKAATNEGDVVLDPFCGCGTTITAAQALRRSWIGIDVTHLAVSLIKGRLGDIFDEAAQHKVVGEPVSLPDAQQLAQTDPYQFQFWALGLIGARGRDEKRGADSGIDGVIRFHDEGRQGTTKQVIISVKAGHTSVAHVRDLRGVIEREKAEMGILLSMAPPTQPMRKEAASAGHYTSPTYGYFPKMQIRTIEELLNGKGIDVPPLHQVSVTFRRAPRVFEKGPEAASLFGDTAEPGV